MIARGAPWAGLFARQLLGAVLTHIGLSLLAGLCLFIAVDAVETGNIADAAARPKELLLLELYNAPLILLELAGMAALIGAPTALAALSRRGEVVAFLAAGASPRAIFKPALLAGLALALTVLGLTEWVAPAAAAEVSLLRRQLGLPAGTENPRRGQRWFRGRDLVFRVDGLEAADGHVLAGVLMLRLQDGRLYERWDAARLVFDGTSWSAEDVTHRRFDGVDGLTTRHAPRLSLPLVERPKDFAESLGAPGRLPLLALRSTIAARERLGRPSLEHRLELYRRVGRPLALLFAVPLGVALALRLGRRPSFSAALGLGGLAGFGLWTLDELGLALASTGALEPAVAAYLGPGLMAAALVAAAFVAERRGLGG